MSEAVYKRRIRIYEEGLHKLRNTYALLASATPRKGKMASIAKAFDETVDEIDRIFKAAHTPVRRAQPFGPCPVECGHDDSSWCNEEQVAEFRRKHPKRDARSDMRDHCERQED